MKRTRSVTLAADDRARVPFALIGVLLLATSATAVGMLATRPADPGVDADPSEVVDKTKGSIQPAVREATREALSDAAKEPVTETADTFAGRAIAPADPETPMFDDEEYDRDWAVFKRYAKLRIYLRARENLELTSHSYRDDVRTEVSLPDVDTTEESVSAAIDRVTLEPGIEGENDLDSGTVRARIDGVEIRVIRNGDVIDRETTSVTVSVPSTAFITHRKVIEYEKRLNMGFDPTRGVTNGLGNRLGWRLYLLAYFKEYHDRLSNWDKNTWTNAKILPPKEVEILANDGIKNVQTRTFGMKDPDLDRIMTGKYVCLLSRVGTKLVNTYWDPSERVKKLMDPTKICALTDLLTGNTLNRKIGTARAIADTLYDDAEKIEEETARYRELIADWNGVRSVVEFLKGETGTKTTQSMTVDVDKFADGVHADFVGSGGDESFEDALGDETCETEACSPENVKDNADDVRDEDETSTKFEAEADVDSVIDDVYSVDTWGEMDDVTKSGSLDTISPDPSPSENWSQVSEEVVLEDSTVTVNAEERWREDGAPERTIYEVSITYENTLIEEEVWECDVDPEYCGGESSETYTGDPSTITFETTVYVVGDYHLQEYLERKPMDADYVESSRLVEGVRPTNLKPAVDDAVSHVFGEEPGSVESTIEGSLRGTKIRSSDEFRSKLGLEAVGPSNNETISVAPADRAALKSWLKDRLQETVATIKDDETVSPLNMSTTEFASADEVFPRLKEQIDTHALAYAGIADEGSYRDAPQKALVKLRKDYIRALKEFLDRAEEERLSTTDEMSDEIGDARGNLKFAQSALDSDETEFTEGNMADPPLLGDVKYSLEVSPTYLSKRPVSHATTPAVGPDYASPENPANTLHSALAINSHQALKEPGLPLIPWPSYWYLSMNYWDVRLKGEYARVQVTGTPADAATPQSTTYVRQEQPVRLEIDEEKHTVGTVEPVNFSTSVPVVGVIPGLIPPPNNGVPLIGRGINKASDLCTPTWDYTGPEFTPGLAAECVPTGGGGTASTVFGQASSSETMSSFLVGVLGETVEEELEERSTPEGMCNEETFRSALSGSNEADVPTATEWFDDLSDDEQGDLVDQYCRLYKDPTTDHGLYAALLEANGDDDRIPESWRRTVLDRREDDDAVETALERAQRIRSNGHDVQKFMTASQVNDDMVENEDEDLAPHEQPGIVISFETGSEVTYERVYEPGDEGSGLVGPWLVPTSVTEELESSEELVAGLALADESVVEPDEARWGNYQCIATVDVPEGTILWMSTANGFDEGDTFYDEADELWGTITHEIPGGETQIYVPTYDEIEHIDREGYQFGPDRYSPDRPVPGTEVDPAECSG